jgi:AraC-like DNA-binding protein/mannose-6-phosphate isomerase-like protein (cupin superfamily)
MKDWAKILSRPESVGRTNRNLTASLAHCSSLEAAGWSFRCGQCHVSTGTYAMGFGFDWHSHHEYQIEVVLAGSFEFETAAEQKILLRRGQAIVIPWKLAHRWTCRKPGAMLGLALELLPTPESIRRDGWLIDRVETVAHSSIKLRTDELMGAAMDTSHPTFQAKVVACRLFLLLAALMEKLFPETGDLPQSSAQAADARGREIVGWVAKYIEENIGGDIRLAHVAREVNLSGRHLHRLFIKHVGKSLHDYLLEHRLEKARQMLLEQGRKALVKEIAFNCGFNSLAYFSNSFRKAYGVAPSALLSQDVHLKQRYTTFLHANPEEAAGRVPSEKSRRSGLS